VSPTAVLVRKGAISREFLAQPTGQLIARRKTSIVT
jgi:hypothetical protein